MKQKSLDIIDLILSNKEIARFSLTTFPPNPIIQERIKLDEISIKQIDRALEIREQLALPFWESIILTFFSQKNYSNNLLNSILFHNENLQHQSFNIKEWKCQKEKIIKGDDNYAFLSEVVTVENEKMHIPLLDFHCPKNPLNEQLAEDVLKNIYIGNGYLLESGDSYHFYGQNLMTEAEMIQFLGKALQFSPIIDKMWIAHQLRELKCALRVSPKHNVYPFLVRMINNV